MMTSMNSALQSLPGAGGRAPLAVRTAAACITGYQRYISPYKGFSCAYRLHHEAESCSQYVKRIVLEEGLQAARTKARSRFAECHAANLALRAQLAKGALFTEVGWLPDLSHSILQAGSWCIPTPFGCCWIKS